MNKYEDEITELATKAAGATDSAAALRFSQAALNLANTVNCQVVTKVNENNM